jgi:methionyl-tRNA formyltransferase
MQSSNQELIMELVFQKMMEKAVKDLDALERKGHLQFKVFTTEGKEYGTLKAATPKVKKERKRSANIFPMGEVRNYILPYLKDLKPDNIVSIPVGKYPAENLRGNVCSWCTVNWGKGTYSSTFNKEKQSVEIYRHAV